MLRSHHEPRILEIQLCAPEVHILMVRGRGKRESERERVRPSEMTELSISRSTWERVFKHKHSMECSGLRGEVTRLCDGCQIQPRSQEGADVPGKRLWYPGWQILCQLLPSAHQLRLCRDQSRGLQEGPWERME